MPRFDPAVNYDHAYWKTYLQNEINISLIRESTERRDHLNELVEQIEVRRGLGRNSRTSTTGSTA